MSFDEFPSIEQGEGIEQVIDVIRRIVDLRQEDVVLLNQLVRYNNYDSGFARVTVSVSDDYSA